MATVLPAIVNELALIKDATYYCTKRGNCHYHCTVPSKNLYKR